MLLCICHLGEMESETVQNFDLHNIVTPVKVDRLNKLLSKTSMLKQDR